MPLNSMTSINAAARSHSVHDASEAIWNEGKTMRCKTMSTPPVLLLRPLRRRSEALYLPSSSPMIEVAPKSGPIVQGFIKNTAADTYLLTIRSLSAAQEGEACVRPVSGTASSTITSAPIQARADCSTYSLADFDFRQPIVKHDGSVVSISRFLIRRRQCGLDPPTSYPADGKRTSMANRTDLPADTDFDRP